MASVASGGLMDQHMRDNSRTTTSMDRVYTYGQTLANMRASG
jgi:hypothetical protein